MRKLNLISFVALIVGIVVNLNAMQNPYNMNIPQEKKMSVVIDYLINQELKKIPKNKHIKQA